MILRCYYLKASSIPFVTFLHDTDVSDGFINFPIDVMINIGSVVNFEAAHVNLS